MSAPETNIELQEKRHKGSLLGMGAAVAVAFILLALLIGYVTDQGGQPEGAAVQIDSRTGAEVSVAD